MKIRFNDRYVIDAAGFWLRQVRSNRGQPPNRQAVEKRRKTFFKKKLQACLSAAASSFCTMPTGTR